MTDQTGATPHAADGVDLDQLLANEQNVPVHVVKAIRQELQTEKGKNQSMQDQLNQLQDALTLYRNQVNMMQQQGGGQGQQGQQQGQANDPLADKDEDEVLTVGEARALMSTAMNNIHSREVMRDLSNRSDFQDVINTHLPNVLRLDPELGQILSALPEAMRYSLGYRLGQLDPNYSGKKVTDQISQEAQRIADNLSKPGSPSGQTTVTPSTLTDKINAIPLGSQEWAQFRAKMRGG